MSPEAEILLLQTSDNNDHCFLGQVISQMPLSGYHLEYFNLMPKTKKKKKILIYFIWTRTRKLGCKPAPLHPSYDLSSSTKDEHIPLTLEAQS